MKMDCLASEHRRGTLFSAVVSACAAVMVAGCGGGSSTSPSVTEPNAAPVTTGQGTTFTGTGGSNGVSGDTNPLQAEAVVTQIAPGWTEPIGTPMIDTSSLARWAFASQKQTAWNPGSVELVTQGDASTSIGLNFDFGCNTSSIVTRDADCRNVVAAYTNLTTPLNATTDSLIALKVRNLDANAEYSLRVKDSSGQTLQYPISVRTIENLNPANWSLVRVPLKHPSNYWQGADDGRINGSIVQITLVAASRNSDSPTLGLNYPKGRLEIKSAQLFSSSGTTYQLKPNAAVNTSGLIPSIDGRMAVAHGNFDSNLLRKAKEAGFSVVRRDLLWEFAEQNGRYAFTSYSNGAENLNLHGMKVLWILDYGHPDHGGAVPQSQSDMEAFGRFVQAATQFGRTQPVYAYEVWNEPNVAGYWPNPDPIAYASLLNTAVTAIRANDPNTPIISGGVGLDEPSFLFKLARTGALSRVNAIGVHPYRKDTYVVTSPAFKRSVSTPEMVANDLYITKAFLASQGVTAPLWNTESGYSTVFFLDPSKYPDALSDSAKNRQGVLLLRSVLTQIAVNQPLITVYRLIDKGVSAADKEMNFGLLDVNGVEKPAYVALKNLNSLIKSKKFNGSHADVPPGLHALRWTDPANGAKTICVWSDQAGEDFSIVLPAGVKSVLDWKGHALTARAGETLSLTEAQGPIYVQF